MNVFGRTGVGFRLLLLAMFTAALPAEAAITFVQNLGTGGTGVTINTSASVTTTGAVTAGNTIFVFVATNNGSDTITCSDPVNGTYTTDVNNGGLQTAICSKHNALALPSGSQITVSVSPFPTNIRISVAEFAGLAAASQLDRTVVTNGIGTSPSVTLGAATTQAYELLIGVVNANTLGAPVLFAPAPNGTSNNCANTGSAGYGTLQSAQGQNAVFPIYCIVTATGTYWAGGDLSSSQSWTVAMATYRALLDATSTSISPSAATVTVGTAQTFTATVTASSVPVTAGTVTFTDTTTSTTLASGVTLDGSGQAATTVTLAEGAHTIQATYNPDFVHAGSSNTTSVTVNTSADLAISTSAAASVTAGQNIVYTITATNGGPSTAANVSVGDVLPPVVTFVSATPTQGSCSGTSTVTCSLGSLSSGATATVTLTVSTSGAASVSNTATVSSSTADPSLANNSSTATTTVTAANQTITFGALANRNFGTAPFAVSATASSTLAVTFISLTGSVCTVSGTTVTMVAVGTCTVAADQSGNASFNAAPRVTQSFSVLAVVPAAPTIVAATAGNGSITVTFTAPAFTGGVSITSYTATCSGVSQAGPSSPIIVNGLTNGTPYSCTVTATNSVGTGPASAPASATPSVNSFTDPTATGSGNATVSFTGGGAGCSFAPAGTGPGQSSFFIPVSGHPKSPPPQESGVTFQHGLLDFVLVGCTPGSTVTFTVTYPAALAARAQYWKYGPTASLSAPHWYVLPATLSGNTAVFSITDGGLGDDDLAANGSIVDQGGPGVPPASGELRQVPTLSEWMMAMLAALLLGSGLRAARRPGAR